MRIERRTIQLDVVGARCDEGPINTGGAVVASVQVQIHPQSPTRTSTTGIIEMIAGVEPGMLEVYSSAQTFGAGLVAGGGVTLLRRNAGDSTIGVAGDAILDFKVNTAEAGVWWLVTVYLNDSKE